MSLANMAARGELQRLPPHKDEPIVLLEAARRRLKDAANPTVYPETRLEQAYTAILTCALAALRAEGYRPARGIGQHARTLETRGLYEGLINVSVTQVEEAVKEAAWLLEGPRRWLAKRYPRLFPS